MNNFNNYNSSYRYYDGGGTTGNDPTPFDPNNLSKKESKELERMGFTTPFLKKSFINSVRSLMPENELGKATFQDYVNVYNTYDRISNMNGGAGFGGHRIIGRGPDGEGGVDEWKDFVGNKMRIHRNGNVVDFEDYTPEQLEHAMFNRFASDGEIAKRDKNWYDTNIAFMNKMAAQDNYDWFNEHSTRKFIEGDNSPYALQKHGDSTFIKDPETGKKYEVLTMTGNDGKMVFVAGPDGAKHGLRTQRIYDPNYRIPTRGREGQEMDAEGYLINSDFTPRANGNMPEQPLQNPVRLPNGNYEIQGSPNKHAYGGRTSRRLYAAGGSMGMIPMGEQEDYNMVGAGGSHEQNPMGGVPYGMNADGSQNMVEQGEASVGNQVFSDRSSLSPELCQQLGLPSVATKKASESLPFF